MNTFKVIKIIKPECQTRTLVLEPEIYSPGINPEGKICDLIPNTFPSQGLSCPCGSRKNKAFFHRASFKQHLTTKCHTAWLSSQNNNIKNLFMNSTEFIEMKNDNKKLHCKLLKSQNKLTQEYKKFQNKIKEMEKKMWALSERKKYYKNRVVLLNSKIKCTESDSNRKSFIYDNDSEDDSYQDAIAEID